jgi:hypothetical protein
MSILVKILAHQRPAHLVIKLTDFLLHFTHAVAPSKY